MHVTICIMGVHPPFSTRVSTNTICLCAPLRRRLRMYDYVGERLCSAHESLVVSFHFTHLTHPLRHFVTPLLVSLHERVGNLLHTVER